MTTGNRTRHSPVIGLALGGGGARGLSHIGILRELAALGVQPDVVAGTSIGALVGAVDLSGHLDFLEDTFLKLKPQDIVRYLDVGLVPGSGLLEGRKAISFFRDRIGERNIEDLPRRYAALATDLNTGREVCLTRGPLWDAVRASISLPGIFSAVRLANRWLVDGGLVNPVPVSACRAMGADVVIAVNLNESTVNRPFAAGKAPRSGARQRLRQKLLRHLPPPLQEQAESAMNRLFGQEGAPGFFEVLTGAINIMQAHTARSQLAGAPPDVLLIPRVAEIGMLDFHRGTEAIQEGRACFKRSLPALREALGQALGA